MKKSVIVPAVNLKYISLFLLMFTVHTLMLFSQPMAVLVSCIEICICVCCLLKCRIDLFLYASLFIIPTSFDIPLFVYGDSEATLYSYLNIPFFQGYLFVVLSLAPIFLIFKDVIFCIKISKTKYPHFFWLLKYLFLFSIIGPFIGIINILLDDNGVRNLPYLKFFCYDFVHYMIPILYMYYFIYAFCNYDFFSVKLTSILRSFIVALIIAAGFSVLFGFRGFYGAEETILMPLTLFYSTLILFCLLFDKEINKTVFFLLTMVAFFLQFSYSNSLGGKSWLVLIFIFGALFIYVYKYHKSFFLISLFPIILLVPTYLFNYTSNNNKLTQAIMLVSLVDGGTYDALPMSPKIRIEEFLNVFEEYKLKPYYLVGKGFGGSIKDYRNGFGIYMEGAFTDAQYKNDTFVFLHETINCMFLKFGVLGLFFILQLLRICMSNFDKSYWLLFGCLWAIFFFDYSAPLALIGTSSLLLGFYKIDSSLV